MYRIQPKTQSTLSGDSKDDIKMSKRNERRKIETNAACVRRVCAAHTHRITEHTDEPT